MTVLRPTEPALPSLERRGGPPPPALRSRYLDSLAEPQELSLENRVSDGEVWSLEGPQGTAGYAVVADGALVELFVSEAWATKLPELFDAVMTVSGAAKVLCKSFDRQLLCAATSRPATVQTVGFHYRKVVDPSFRPRDGVAFRPGTLADGDAVLDIDDGFFRDRAEIERYAEAGGLALLVQTDGTLVGCGVSKPVIAGRGDIDIGMFVAPAFRRRGYGAHLVSHLKHRALAAGQRPICGCAAANIASRRTLERAGFVSEHRLLELTY